MKTGEYVVNLSTLATRIREELDTKKYVLLYAYNGTGKTRLSMEFKNIGKQGESRDTLYFNAFTEDLFTWDNDLDGDSLRKLRINAASRFFAGVGELEMETRIRTLLLRYADFDFRIDTEDWSIAFSRSTAGATFDNIKVSRGEENIFIWCFFLAIVQLAIDGAEAYQWVKFIYVDDPVSSLDEHNAIAVASHLAQMLKRPENQLRTVISSHHSLYFNVMCNELGNARKYFLSGSGDGGYYLTDTGDTPFFQHVAIVAELYEADRTGRLFTYHFNMLRTVLEKAASFHGFKNFSACIKQTADDHEGVLHTRLINILSHGNYSLYEPREMQEENKAYFRRILHDFLAKYPFNPELFVIEEAK